MNEKAKRVVRGLCGARGCLALGTMYAQMKNRGDAEAMKMVPGNKKYKDIHRGERCFILGNGPSLKDVDLSLLGKEWVFTVNNFWKMENYTAAHTNFHLWMDFAFFDMCDAYYLDMDDVLRGYDLIRRENPVVFVPAASYQFFKERDMLDWFDINYFYSGGSSLEEKLDLNIAASITPFSTVVHCAITVAIYMGFSRIYLLGCDATNIIGIFDTVLNKNNTMHAYDDNNGTETVIKNLDMSTAMYCRYRDFLGYDKLYQYCKGNGIELVNCSSQTLITSIPRMPLQKVLCQHA